MALDVNGYSSIFKSFVNFAETNKHSPPRSPIAASRP